MEDMPEGPGGRRSSIAVLKQEQALGGLRSTNTLLGLLGPWGQRVFATGKETRVGQILQSGQRTGLQCGLLGRGSGGSVFTPVLFICKKCKCKSAKQAQVLPGVTCSSPSRVPW